MRRRRQSLDSYLAVTDSHLARFRDHFLIDEALNFDILRDAGLIEGSLGFVDELSLDVTIDLVVDANRRIEVVDYRFHASIERGRHRPVCRYDNAHAYPGHPDAHHKHTFDPLNPDALGSVAWVGAANQPDLGAVLAELHGWWFATGRFLDLRES